jgi:hypothetical protein
MNTTPIWKKKCKATSAEAIFKLQSVGILARPVSEDKVLIVMPNGTTIELKSK